MNVSEHEVKKQVSFSLIQAYMRVKGTSQPVAASAYWLVLHVLLASAYLYFFNLAKAID